MDLAIIAMRETVKRIDGVMARVPMGVTLREYDTMKELKEKIRETLRIMEDD